jgi:cytochrome b pre-mRNA-processing protein 3
MGRVLNPLASLSPWRRKGAEAEKLYGAIVAQARLPFFYRDLGIPDTLEGRFGLLSLHLFAVLHRLRAGDAEASSLAQELTDRFTEDMETVLREVGVGDLSIPKKVRGLAAASAALLQGYEKAFAAAIARALPLEGEAAETAARRLVSYLKEVVRHLESQPVAALATGEINFPEVSDLSGKGLGDRVQ